MKNKLFVSSLLLSCCYSFAWAQEEPLPNFYRHDIGFNTTFILQGVFSSNQTPFSIMYKKYKEEHKATRYGLNLSFNFDSNSPESTSTFYTNLSRGNVAFSLGKEFQHLIQSSKWIWYYGGDLEPFYEFDNRDQYSNNQKYLETEYSRFGLNVRPFLGIRFNLHDRLYLSAETYINLRYARTHNYQKYTDSQNPLIDTQGNSLAFYIQPATGIFIFYRL